VLSFSELVGLTCMSGKRLMGEGRLRNETVTGILFLVIDSLKVIHGWLASRQRRVLLKVHTTTYSVVVTI